ncbi:MAG: hypothetical protein J5892_05540 [Bacilli bacterium]|nr:hypothetical protein [Bacilli bacterium]
MKVIDKNTWDRKDLFMHYDSCNNPFIYLTIPIDITNLYHFSKENNYPFYPTMGYVINKAVNQVDAFKYRKVDDEIIFYENINSNYTEMINEEKIGYFKVNYNSNFKAYIDEYNNQLKALKNGLLTSVDTLNHDEIWFSCAPWFNFTSLITPFNKETTIPQFIWDKFNKENDQVSINLMIMVHHGFADGYQINRFIKILETEINNCKGEE